MYRNIAFFRLNTLSFTMVIISIFWINGCSTSFVARNANKSGFLGDYSEFTKGTGEPGQLAQLRYIAPNAAAICSKYVGVIIDPVTIWTKGGSNLAKIPQKDREMLAGLLGGEVTRAASQAGYGIVEYTGPKVMRIRVALTEGEQSNVVLDTVTTVIPQTFVISSAISGISDTPGFSGEGSVEAELTDSESGKRIIAGVNRRLGGKAWEGKLDSWGHIKDAISVWGKNFEQKLKECKAGTLH